MPTNVGARIDDRVCVRHDEIGRDRPVPRPLVRVRRDDDPVRLRARRTHAREDALEVRAVRLRGYTGVLTRLERPYERGEPVPVAPVLSGLLRDAPERLVAGPGEDRDLTVAQRIQPGRGTDIPSLRSGQLEVLEGGRRGDQRHTSGGDVRDGGPVGQGEVLTDARMRDPHLVEGPARRAHAVPPVVERVVVGTAHQVEAHLPRVPGEGEVGEHVAPAVRHHGRQVRFGPEDDLQVRECHVRATDRFHHPLVPFFHVHRQGPAHDGISDQRQRDVATRRTVWSLGAGGRWEEHTGGKEKGTETEHGGCREPPRIRNAVRF